MLIHEFHSKLDLRSDRGTLFHALRRLRSLSGVKSFAVEAEGWIVWADDARNPDDGGDGGSLCVAVAMA